MTDNLSNQPVFINGASFYFRARGSHWKLTIAPTINEAVNEENVLYTHQEEYGEKGSFDASWMPHRKALQFIYSSLMKWLEISGS
ncbi:MAG: hypothetical protein NVS2B14_11010 [Chamaesiphon sp.]